MRGRETRKREMEREEKGREMRKEGRGRERNTDEKRGRERIMMLNNVYVKYVKYTNLFIGWIDSVVCPSP